MRPLIVSTPCWLIRWAIGAFAAVMLILGATWTHIQPRQRPISPARGETEPFTRAPFAEHAYCASDAALPAGLSARGSWLGGDGFTGTFVSGWYEARHRLTIMVCGYPRDPGNTLALEVRLAAGAVQRLAYDGIDPRENWRCWRIILPFDAIAFRIIATDGSTKFHGWLGISQPAATEANLALLPQALRTLLAFIGQGVLLLAIAMALHQCLRRHFALPEELAPLVAFAGVALLGFFAFWSYLASPILGRVFSWAVLTASVVILLVPVRAGGVYDGKDELLPLSVLMCLVGLGFVSSTCLFGDAPFSYLAANRFMPNLRVDNEIPQLFADRLWLGQSPRQLIGDWLSSDRPPLQTGWLLLTRPVFASLGVDIDTAAGTGGVWFQLLWIPAMGATLRRIGASTREAAALIAAVAFTGFQMFYTIYTWPKLGAAALVLGAFVLWRPESDDATYLGRFALGGACAALGWLAHGGVAFSVLGLAPLGLVSLLRERHAWRRWLAAGVTFAAFAAPWIAYQEFYEPPANRLLKWHLAGVIPPDSRGFGETLIDSYSRLGWHGALANRWRNLQLQWAGDWRNLLRFKPTADPLLRRVDETNFTGRTFGWWLPAAVALPWVLLRRRIPMGGVLGWALVWWISGWLVWLALMFLPGSASAHQGTLVTQLLGFSLLMWAAFSLHRIVFLVLTVMQIVTFMIVWVPASSVATDRANAVAVIVAAVAALCLIAVILRGTITRWNQPNVPL